MDDHKSKGHEESDQKVHRDQPRMVGGQKGRRHKESDQKVHRDQPRAVEVEGSDIQRCLHMNQPRAVGVDNGLRRGCKGPGLKISARSTKRNLGNGARRGERQRESGGSNVQPMRQAGKMY